MSKNKQILIFSGIGLAVLGGVAAVLMLTEPKKAEEPEPADEPDTSIVMTDKDEEAVLKLHVKNETDEYDIVKNGEVWTIAGLEKANVVDSSLERAVSAAASLTADQLVEENAADLEKYGLMPPQAQVTVSFTDGTDFSFSFGSETPTSSSKVYISDSAGSVYTCVKTGITVLSGDKLSFINKQAIHSMESENSEEITLFKVERTDLEKPITIEPAPAPADPDEISVFSYRLTSPFTAYTELSNTEIIYSLHGLTATEVVKFGLTANDLEEYGIASPSCKVSVETSASSFSLMLGKLKTSETTDSEGNTKTDILGIYGISSEVPDTLFLFDYKIPAIAVTTDYLLAKNFLMPYIRAISEIRYEDNKGASFVLGLEPLGTENGEKVYAHTLNGEDMNEQILKNMFQFLISAKGEETYYSEEKGELLAEVHCVYTDKSRGEEVVRYYSSPDDRKVIVNVNGVNLFKMKQIYVTQLHQNAERILSGEDVVLTS